MEAPWGAYRYRPRWVPGSCVPFFPDTLAFDPLSGDNGPNFFGHAWNTATYIVDHPEFGWLAFRGNIK